MQRVAFGQVPLDAAPKRRERDTPVIASIGISGTFAPEHICSDEGTYPVLDQSEHVLVMIQDADGNLVAQGQGYVEVGFKDKDGFTIREQKVKL
jgi:hypothetical protein